MSAIDRRLIQNFDWPLFGLVSVLLTMGIVNLVSATAGDSGLSPEVLRQLLAMGLGGIGMVVVLAIDYRHYERLAVPMFAVCLALLAATLVFAPVTRGSRSWLFGGSFEPSEFA